MAYWSEDLQQLKNKVVQKKRLETELHDLHMQKCELEEKLHS